MGPGAVSGRRTQVGAGRAMVLYPGGASNWHVADPAMKSSRLGAATDRAQFTVRGTTRSSRFRRQGADADGRRQAHP